jgi:hypothetical protein
MQWWKAVLVDLATIIVAVGLLGTTFRDWRQRREQLRWPASLATVTGYKQGPGFKGRSCTYLLGHFDNNGRSQEFSVAWAASDLSPRTTKPRSWIPPEGTPALGSSIGIHFDPARPSVVAIENAPVVARDFWVNAVIVAVAMCIGVAVWFM